MKSILASWLSLALVAFVLAGDARAQDSDDSAPFANNKTAPAPFSVAPASGFGAIGQWVLTMKTTGDNGYVFFHKPSGGDWTLSLHPSIDYFITNNVSLGATFGYSYSPAETGTTVVDLGARAGFNLTINDNLGFWPTAGLSVNVDSRNHTTNTHTAFGVFAPFLYHLVPHLFVGLGPSFALPLSGGGGNAYGVDFVLGGWL